MKKIFLFILSAMLFANQSSVLAQVYTGLFRTPAGNTEAHIFSCNSSHETSTAVYINQETTTGAILRLAGGYPHFNTGVKFSFESNGNLGMGLMSPVEKLVMFTPDTIPVLTQYRNHGTWLTVNSGFVVGVLGNGNGTIWHRDPKYLSFGTYNKERMRITYNGDIDIYGPLRSETGSYRLDTTGIFQSKGYRTMTGNTKYHHLTNNHSTESALFINQETTTGPILRLSSGSAFANSHVKFSFEGSGNLGLGTTNTPEKLVLYNDGAVPVYSQYGNGTLGIGVERSFVVGISNDANARVWHRESKNLSFGTNNTERMHINANGNIGIGTTSPDRKLDVVGVIRAHSVEISTTKTADFVFEEDYSLMPLLEVEQFITTNKHLPEIAPAAEMLEKGLDMGEMQIKLLQKIEELTLYVIQQQKEIDELRRELKTKN